MAITVNKHIILDGSRNCIIKFILSSDAASDVTDQKLLTIADLIPAPEDDVKISRIQSVNEGMEVTLSWEGAVNKKIVTLRRNEPVDMDYCHIGGLVNDVPRSDDSRTGDILFSTNNAAADEDVTIILHMKKRGEHRVESDSSYGS